MSVRDLDSLSTYLQAQREIRKLSESMSSLDNDDIRAAAGDLKADIERLMESYNLTPEQMLEGVCYLFELRQPAISRHGDGGVSQEPLGFKADDASRQSGLKDVTQNMGRARRVVIRSRRQADNQEQPVQPAMSSDSAAIDMSAQEQFDGRDSAIVAPAVNSLVSRRFVYENPHTGEVVKTRGKHHRTLNEWRGKYGDKEVESWRQSDS